MLTDLPMIEFYDVFHVGSLNVEDRQDWSYEGMGLSVSVHPDDWAQIAKLGRKTFEFTKPNFEPFLFVSWHDLTDTDRNTLRDWAHTQGWVEQRLVYRATWFDEDYDDTMSMDFDTEAEALAEVEDQEDANPVEAVLVWRPTAAFPDTRVDKDCDPTDAILSHYIRTSLPHIDGVWWEDDYDPELLSCPRGVLVHDVTTYERRVC